MKKVIIVLILVSFLVPELAFAHPGKLDKRGGHVCRTNCEKWGFKYGEWHKHKNIAGTKNVNVKMKSKVKAKPAAKKFKK